MKSKKLVIIICMLVTASVFPIVTTSVASDGNVIYVDDDGGADYTNIQDAIDAASDGDTIFVYQGIYHEQIVINKEISVVGEDRDITIIDCFEMKDEINNSAVVSIISDNVVFSDFSIQYSGDTRPLNL